MVPRLVTFVLGVVFNFVLFALLRGDPTPRD